MLGGMKEETEDGAEEIALDGSEIGRGAISKGRTDGMDRRLEFEA